jgi:hypothetical protein
MLTDLFPLLITIVHYVSSFFRKHLIFKEQIIISNNYTYISNILSSGGLIKCGQRTKQIN